jgi:amino acid adenylation domain-containing protein
LQRPCQYADFAIWQRQWIQGPVFASQMDYWRQQLGGNLPTLELPTDWPRPVVQDTHAAQLTGVLSAQETQALKALGQQVHATPFMVLLAALQLLLYRYTGQDDIVVASPIANRQQQDTEQALGLFLNTLVLRTSLAGLSTFRELLQRVRAVTLAAYEHQDVPFEALVEAIRPTRDLSRPPLYDVMLNSLEQLGQEWEFAEVAIEPLGVEETRARCALTVYVREHQGGLAFRLVYQRALFAAPRMQAFLDQYRHLLRQIITAPDQTIETYSLVPPEATALLPNPRQVIEQPLYEVVPQQCLTWAQRTPQHPAVMQGTHCWTYAELAERAATVARALCAHGVARGDVVALYGTPSFGLIVSMLGVLQSGGVMLMLDPHLPPQRRRLMLQEAGATAYLQIGTLEALDIWEEDAVGDIWHIEAQTGKLPESLTTPAPTLPLPALQPDDAAYIFFTSGSTGIPKGVLGCHKGLSHFLQWQRETFHITAEDRVAQLTGLSFDVVLRDIFLPLTSGATLVLPHETDRQSGCDVVRWLDQQCITVVHAVPTIAHTWLADGPYETTLPALRLVFFAGEPLTEQLVHQWRAAFPHGTLVNLYGPTETTLAKCWYGIPMQVLPGVQPVGQPLPHTQALVVAGQQRLCGIGEPGEIVMRTPYRSLGYIRTAGDNASRFVPNPWSGDVQDWLYYTGDRGRYRPDATLEVLGRLDDQIKIRGVRIEPGEVTAVLQRHPGVQACVVTARRDQHDQFFLAAYVVTAQPQQTTPGLLRTFLRHYLPTVMLPTTFTYLERLPLTPTGKVDRQSLPEPAVDTTDIRTPYIAPRTPIEQSLVDIWRDIMAAQAIGIYDDFFDLGGHSLLATRMLARIREQFHMELPLRVLFEQPTVAGLAIVILQTYAEQMVDSGLEIL